MTSGMFFVVDPPAAGPPRGATLLRSANIITETDPHWMGGLRWRPLICGSSAVDKGIEVCAAFSGFDVPSGPPAASDYNVPSVAVGVPCSGISGEEELRGAIDRAAALLDRCETLGIARELWKGTVATAEAWLNDFLGNAATLHKPNGNTSTAAIDALAWLEEDLAQRACAGGSMIHCSPYTATVWESCHLLERQPDGRLLTALGTIVVADPGYDGSDPSGAVDATKATAWAYGTGMVDVRRGPVQQWPKRDDMERGLKISNNDFNAYAYRPFAATFDPCAHVGIKVNHASRS